MKIPSQAPHDFYLTFDVTDYYDKEQQDFEAIFERGLVRPLTLSTRAVLSVIEFNGNPEEPEFEVTFPGFDLDDAELGEAESQVRRIVGADLDLSGLMEQAADDVLLGPLLTEYYGLKRVARGSFWEDAFDDIIRTRISHRPTARRMAQDVRRTYGVHFEFDGEDYYSYPQPAAVVGSEPEMWRDEWGISRRKAEYVTGLGEAIASGEVSLTELEEMSPDDFYVRVQKVRGIGPSTAQDLMIQRNRTDACFPSNRSKDKEKGLRRWIMYSYGVDPDAATEEEFQELIANWKGYEAMAIRFLYYNYIMKEKEKAAK